MLIAHQQLLHSKRLAYSCKHASIDANKPAKLLFSLINLSIAHQHLQAIKEGRKRFLFLGQDIRLIPSCGIFVTMNPGYAGGCRQSMAAAMACTVTSACRQTAAESSGTSRCVWTAQQHQVAHERA